MFPKLANVPVDAVTGTDVMTVLLPIWTTKTETAGRVRRRIGAVTKWAVAQGYRTDNPAGEAISAALPNNNAKSTHRQALAYAEVGAAVAKVRRSGAYRGAVLSFDSWFSPPPARPRSAARRGTRSTSRPPFGRSGPSA